MTLYEFNLLDDKSDEKLMAVLMNGECIAMRDEGDCKFTLYQVCSFYVEISSGANLDGNLKYRSFTSLEPLEPYLDEIDISTLINS